jgi:hypothetical protein
MAAHSWEDIIADSKPNLCQRQWPTRPGIRLTTKVANLGRRIPIVEGDCSAFVLSAPITHGDNGGPVINERGEVVAITVAGNDQAAGQNMAIPINLAKGLSNFRPSPGQTLELWDTGLMLYSQGHVNWA